MLLPFENILINKKEIPQGQLNIENKVRSNLFTWNGQFSPQFIETLLNFYAKEGYVLVDPFVGSGTTLCEAARKGISAYGMELNASAYYMAKTYELVNKTISERIDILNSIEDIFQKIDSNESILSILTEYVQNGKDSNIKSLLSTLIILLDIYNHDISLPYLNKKWNTLKSIVLGLPVSKEPIKVDMGDARNLHCDSNKADLLITSPPYINVFNYHQKYRRSVEALGYNVLTIARNEFGSNRKNRGNRLLTVIQYCIDMALSLKEAIRVCKPNARMIYIVGRESTVLGYSFCNSQLIYEIATSIFGLPFILRQERVFKNRFGQLIYEDILHFRNYKTLNDIDDSLIEETAKNIAVKMLLQKEKLFPNSKNLEFIVDAIKRSEFVKKSEG